MERYVVSRELAEKLKAAGYPRQTQYVWNRKGTEWELGTFLWSDAVDVAAPLTDELLEQLPENARIELYKRVFYEDSRYWSWGIEAGQQGGSTWYVEDADKPADALAELWLWCKQNGYIQEAN